MNVGPLHPGPIDLTTGASLPEVAGTDGILICADITAPGCWPQDGDDASEGGLRSVLRAHYLAQVVCDHERKMDNPVCACSRVHLGWHASVGDAVEAWIDHVMAEIAVCGDI